MRFVIRVGTIRSGLLEGDPDLVDRLLSVADPDAMRDRALFLRLSDGKYHFFDHRSRTFPAGLTARLQHRLQRRGHQVDIVDDEPAVQVSRVEAAYLVGRDLRDYQVEAVNVALERRRGILWMATNAGKSSVIAAIAGKLVREARMRAIVVVPNAYLLHQTSNDIAQLLGADVKVGRAGDKQRQLACDVLVSTYQTLVGGALVGARRDEELAGWLRTAGAILVDEAHHAASDAYTRILQAAVAARVRLGFTGSLDKRDRRKSAARRWSQAKAVLHRWKTEAFLGPVLYHVDNEFLISAGYSAEPRIIVIKDRAAYGGSVATPRIMLGARANAAAIYGEVFERAVLKDAVFHRTVAEVVRALLAAKRPPFVFSHSVQLLQTLGNVFERERVAHRVLHGKHETAERRAVVQEFAKRGDFAVLSSSIFDEGASIPEIRAAVLVGARKSPIELLQRIGRSVRRKEGDNTVIVVDFDPLHAPLLHDHFEARLATYRSERFNVRFVYDLSQIASAVG